MLPGMPCVVMTTRQVALQHPGPSNCGFLIKSITAVNGGRGDPPVVPQTTPIIVLLSRVWKWANNTAGASACTQSKTAFPFHWPSQPSGVWTQKALFNVHESTVVMQRMPWWPSQSGGGPIEKWLCFWESFGQIVTMGWVGRPTGGWGGGEGEALVASPGCG